MVMTLVHSFEFINISILLSLDAEIRPVDQAMIISYSFVSVYANIYLYSFLQTQATTNTATKNLDVKKMRQRNIIPAQVGILNMIGLVVTYILYFIIYSIPNGRLVNLDTGTRSVIFCHMLDNAVLFDQILHTHGVP